MPRDHDGDHEHRRPHFLRRRHSYGPYYRPYPNPWYRPNYVVVKKDEDKEMMKYMLYAMAVLAALVLFLLVRK